VKAYVVYCHPDPQSFTAAVRDRVISTLESSGHSVRVADLYGSGFDPALSRRELAQHGLPVESKDADSVAALADDVDALTWCDTLILVYPTWWSGQPAMLTGWLDRVLMCGVAWEPPRRGTRIHGRLKNIRRVVAVTTHGSRRVINMLEGETGKRVMGRAVRALCHPLARTTWLALYDIDRSTGAQRAGFLDRVERRLRRW
jgi:putative NADPH-quinone reductase